MIRNIIFVLFASCMFFGSCTMDMRDKDHKVSTSNIVASDTAKVVYQCPMKCQGDTAYVNPGTCPVCKMDLEKKEK